MHPADRWLWSKLIHQIDDKLNDVLTPLKEMKELKAQRNTLESRFLWYSGEKPMDRGSYAWNGSKETEKASKRR